MSSTGGVARGRLAVERKNWRKVRPILELLTCPCWSVTRVQAILASVDGLLLARHSFGSKNRL